MKNKDKMFTGVGLLITVVGIILTIFWGPEVGLVCVFLLGLLLLSLILLERRQIARLQERVLSLVNAENNRRKKETTQSLDAASWKKILGLLQAQQVSMEILSQQVLDISEKTENPSDCD